MGTNLNGYHLADPIHEGVKTIIYRGIKELEQTSVIVKTLKAEYPSLEEITRLRHEYKILEQLDIEGVVKAYALEKYQHGLALILENFGEQSLKNYINSTKIDIIDFLKISIQLASALGKLHEQNIIHKDIKPHNILIDSATGEVRIIDFSIATRLSRENVPSSNPNLLEGTLAYMSPEQTGRMNRALDYRTDFYSLGVTFYEILTGQLPFSTNDPMELVHCHIAKEPLSPHEVNPEISRSISSIVMKLLAKNAEDRYQSASGLTVDLKECLSQALKTGGIQYFIPGQRDKSGQFLIPQKLYGRETEVATLLGAFERVSQGESEIMLVSGYSGIGKSSLVNEIHKPIVRQRGYFISGKFDQFKKNIPYAALIQAFADLVRQLLTETSEEIGSWKEKLEAALGEQGKVIIDVIPEVELIIGKQPDVPQLGPNESQNRFNRVFKQFIHVFTKKEHPLVLFLDDLQWADSASLKLIQLLITDSDSEYLLTIGAYRDNEVNPTHPLIITLEEIEKAGAIINNIILRPLGIADIRQLLGDTLCETERSKEIADLIWHKTQGNPFFLTQLLQTLYAEKLLKFDFERSCWNWTIAQIQSVAITDYDVVELLARNIKKLSAGTQEILKLAACIGNQFSLDVLAVVNEKSILTTAEELWEALQTGLILPLSNAYKIPLFFDRSAHGALLVENIRVGYKFLHDRVQQAAYSLIPEDQKKATHLRIGQLLLQNIDRDALSENIFDIVNKLNIGREFITERSQRDELAELNLIAGRKAKAATAYEAAVKYFTTGLELLAKDGWDSQYELTFNIHVEAVETQYLNTNFAGAATIAEVALAKAKTILDRVKVDRLKIQFYVAQGQMQLAFDTGVQALEMLGVKLSDTTLDRLPILPEIESLEDIPEMSDPYKIAALQVLMAIIAPVYIIKPELLPLVILTIVNFSIEYGHCALTAYAYAWYGLLLCGAMGDLDTGYYAGQLALRLLEKYRANSLKCKIYDLFNGSIRPWKEHLKESLTGFKDGIQSGLETGDIEWTSYNTMFYCNYIFLSGEQLESVEQEQRQYVDLLVNLKQEASIGYAKIWEQLTLNLLGKAADKSRLIGESFDETVMLPQLQQSNNRLSLFATYLAKLILGYLYKDYAQALEASRLASESSQAATGLITTAQYNFYSSLVLLANYQQANTNEQEKYLAEVEANQEKMKQWATHAPMNYQHKYDLVEAEKARVLGQRLEAMELYDRAIQAAKNQGYIQEEALGNELAAEFYLALGREKVAKTYMTDAYYNYISWGATAKVQDLAKRYPHLISRTIFTGTSNFDTVRTTTSTTGETSAALDLDAVLKASQAISGEIVRSKLLENLMKILIENAGAQRGILLTKRENSWVIEAEGYVDKQNVTVLQSVSIETIKSLPFSIVNYVERTEKALVLDDATQTKPFTKDPYIATNQIKSILCFPIIYQGKLTGLFYLENNLTAGAFTADRVEVLKVLTAQVSISIENARLYELEREKSHQLEQSLYKLQQTQSQLIQTEKISSLGQLVAGVAHEVNNPVSFISGNLHHAIEYTSNLVNHLQLYQQYCSKPPAEILNHAEEIELEYLIEDLPKMLASMQVGTERIRDIMQSLRNFSRVDEAEKKAVDIHSGIESTLMILQHRLKAKPERPAINVVKNYGNLPLIECYPGQLNQVFMNILANAIDAFDEYNSKRTSAESDRNPNKITISTEVVSNENSLTKDKVVIRLADNGPGIPEEVQKRIFDPFFTTKPVGKGTGLGLSISYQIVAEKHGGSLQCVSQACQGTEFIIEIPVN